MTFQAVAHGTFQGGMSSISGGKFWSGFAAGALSSIASSAWSGGGTGQWQGIGGKFADSGAGMIAFGTVSGGAGAALTGGNFWQGAITGLVVSGLNHAAHQGDSYEDGEVDPPIKKGIIKPKATMNLLCDRDSNGILFGIPLMPERYKWIARPFALIHFLFIKRIYFSTLCSRLLFLKENC